MEWSRTKSILILVLAIVNMFLLANLERAKAEKLDLSEQYVADATVMLSGRGVTVPEGIMPRRRIALPAAEFETAQMLYPLARAAIGDGDAQPVIEGDGIAFTGADGTFLLLSDTDFTFTPSGPRPDLAAILEEAGFERGSFESDSAFGARLLIGGVRVEGCGVEWDGRRFSGTLVNPSGLTLRYVDLLDPVNALMRFADHVEGPVEVESVEEVYLLEQGGLFKTVTVAPAYRITAGGDTCLVDAVTGEIKLYQD